MPESGQWNQWRFDEGQLCGTYPQRQPPARKRPSRSRNDRQVQAHCGLMICAAQQAKQHQPVISGIDGLGGKQPIAHYRADCFKQFQIDESHELDQEKGVTKHLRRRQKPYLPRARGGRRGAVYTVGDEERTSYSRMENYDEAYPYHPRGLRSSQHGPR